jgi:formylglycine-generating enzyme required for sulfatase activity/predicted Ser/Thr protein kinase
MSEGLPPIAAGTRLGRYEVRSKLGAGGMAEVYLADDTALGRKVALKLLPAAAAADAHARKRLFREARAAATLDHPHICAVYEVGEADGRAFIAMQYVEGETLHARLRRSPLDRREILAIAVDVADALVEAHAHGILHRDIKPANIMLTPRGEAKVMDFGLAKPTGAGGSDVGDAETGTLLSTPGELVGTAPYMSPEQLRGEPADGRSDLFSVGIVLYEMISGQRPFTGATQAAIGSAILTYEPPPLGRFAPDTPPELDRIVAKALRKNPEERYQTAKDLLIDLRTLKEEQEFQQRLEREAPSAGGMAAPAARDPASRSGAGVPSTLPATARVGARSPAVWTAGGLIVLALAAGGGWFAWRTANARWAAAQLPRIAELADADRTFEAYDLAVAVERYLPNNPTWAGVMPAIADTISVTTDPPGARVYLKRFAPDAAVPPERKLIGMTPLSAVRIARGQYILAIERDGYAPVERTVSTLRARLQPTLSIVPPPLRVEERLLPVDQVPPGMVFVPGSTYRLVAWSRPTDRRVPLHDYFIDKYEVSNQEFREFISAGGYVRREFWTHPFEQDGRPLSWDDAMKLFVDRTGLPGPRDWSNQTVPDGKSDHPVTGVSWYEAEAYGRFRGRRLPTVYEWEKAARNGLIGPAGVMVMPWGLFFPGDAFDNRANFGGGTAPVRANESGMSPFGVYNMAGNVAEWTRNDSSDGYLATGGAWGDPLYTFAQYGGRPGLFSSAKLGFRLAKDAGGSGTQGGDRIEFTKEIPVYPPTSETQFRELAKAYAYEKLPLDARIEATTDAPDWTRERITFAGAGGARAIGYLYLPKHVARPLQVVQYVPGGDVDNGLRSLPDSMDDRLAPFVRTGRAAFGVVLQGYIERLEPRSAPPPINSVEYLESVVNHVTDLQRGLDYLETRQDIDMKRLAFFGPSAGAQIGLILAAVDPRYRAVLMVGAGLPAGYRLAIPAANPINFASHIRAPKLIVQGRYDEDTPLSTAADPLYKLLVEPKRRALYEGGHVPMLDVLMTATSGWLDEQLGPVKR